MPSGPDITVPLQRLVHWYEGLCPATLGELPQHYAEQAQFKDPFNEVQGQAAISRIFAHMFRTLQEPRFVVHQRVAQGRDAFLVWDFHFRRADGRAMCVRGASHLQFDAHGRVQRHRDYWDAAEELYAKLPLIGAVLRWLQRRLSAA